MSDWNVEFEKWLKKLEEQREVARVSPPDGQDASGQYGQWILCDDRLPEAGQDVILLFHDTFHTHPDWPKVVVSTAWRCNVDKERTPKGEWALTGRLYSICPKVISIKNGIAWMALPEPPKEG
jgi:hypothetical protein